MSTHHCMHCDCANFPDASGEKRRCCFCKELKGEESNMVIHARREMLRMETDPWFIETIIDVIKAFARSGHSGGSASFAIPIIYELLQFHNLTPLTDDPDEWNQVDDATWQSTRRSDAFSPNGGGIFFLLDDSRQNPEQETVFYESFPTNPELDRKWVDPMTGRVKEWKGEEDGWIVLYDPNEPNEETEDEQEDDGNSGDRGDVDPGDAGSDQVVEGVEG